MYLPTWVSGVLARSALLASTGERGSTGVPVSSGWGSGPFLYAEGDYAGAASCHKHLVRVAHMQRFQTPFLLRHQEDLWDPSKCAFTHTPDLKHQPHFCKIRKHKSSLIFFISSRHFRKTRRPQRRRQIAGGERQFKWRRRPLSSIKHHMYRQNALLFVL